MVVFTVVSPVLPYSIFDNSTIQIDMSRNTQGVSFSNHGEVREQKGQDRVNHLMDIAVKRKDDLDNQDK